MKQMNKEELIEYFIEQLGDNEILGKVMSIEQIREKLINIVENVTYNNEPGNLAGECIINQNGRVTINFDTRKISNLEKNVTIVHELLHALSTRSKPIDSFFGYQEIHEENCGLHLIQTHYFPEGEKMSMGRNCAINEGMTDTLTENITSDFHNGYNTEKDIYRIVSIIVGEDNMLQKYFSDQVYEEKTLNVFEEDIIEKYGVDFGNKLNDDLKKVFSLSDQLLDLDRTDVIYGLNANGKDIQSKTKDEIYNTLENMIYQIIEHEPDAMMRIQEILEPGFNTRLREKIADKVLGDLIKSDEFDIKTKFAFLNYVQEGKNKYYEILKPIVEELLENPETKKMSSEYILKQYSDLCGPKCNKEKLYNMYIDSGMITNGEFDKSRLFVQEIHGYSFEEVNQELAEIKYSKMGDFYQVYKSEYDERFPVFVNKQGKVFYGRTLEFNPFRNNKIDMEDFYSLPTFMRKKEQMDILSQQIKQVVLDFKDSYSDEDIKRTNARLEIYGEIIEINEYLDVKDTDIRMKKYYSIKSDGTLEEIEARSRA